MRLKECNYNKLKCPLNSVLLYLPFTKNPCPPHHNENESGQTKWKFLHRQTKLAFPQRRSESPEIKRKDLPLRNPIHNCRRSQSRHWRRDHQHLSLRSFLKLSQLRNLLRILTYP